MTVGNVITIVSQWLILFIIQLAILDEIGITEQVDVFFQILLACVYVCTIKMVLIKSKQKG